MVVGKIKDDSLISLSPAKPAASADVTRNRVLSYMTTKSRTAMLIEAVGAIGNEERGAATPAIIKWIMANYAVLNENKLKLQIKKAILKALDDGTIMRSQTSRGALGIGGSFVLGSTTKSGRLPSPTPKDSRVKPMKTSQTKLKKRNSLKQADRINSEADMGLHRERKISEEI